jgi:hypothetical protein
VGDVEGERLKAGFGGLQVGDREVDIELNGGWLGILPNAWRPRVARYKLNRRVVSLRIGDAGNYAVKIKIGGEGWRCRSGKRENGGKLAEPGNNSLPYKSVSTIPFDMAGGG